MSQAGIRPDFERPESEVVTKTENTRRCILSGDVEDPGQLLKFVVGPDQRVYLDLDLKLPGRGMWLQARPDVIEKALGKNAFSRAARQKVVTDHLSVADIDQQLLARIISLIAMGRRSSQSIGGIDKVLKKILAYRAKYANKKPVVTEQSENDPAKMIIFCAKDCGQDNLQKILHQTRDYGESVHIERELLGSEIGKAFGRSSLAFCVVESGKISQKLYEKLFLLNALRQNA